MEIYQLRTFITVARQGNLTQAAEILHLSQPAVTAQIKALEEETGVSLFDRGPGGVVLTEAGKLLLPEAEKILSCSRDMLNRAHELKGGLSGKLRIGTILTPDVLRLGPWLACMRHAFPQIQLTTLQGISGAVLSEVRKKELHAGFFIGRNPYQTVHSLRLACLSYVVAVPAAWRMRLQDADWAALGREPWVGVSPFSSMGQLHNEVWRAHNIAPCKVAEVDQEQTMQACVEAELGVCILRREPAELAMKEDRLWIWGSAGVDLDLAFIYAAEMSSDPLIQAMLFSLDKIWLTPL